MDEVQAQPEPQPPRAGPQPEIRRASDRAYARLRREIIDGALAPGTMLYEVEQSERLGVSRTPLREALARLAADGLVAPAGGRGLIVTEVSVDGIAELYELRQALEDQAARLAAIRRDPAVFTALRRDFALAPELAGGTQEQLQRYYALIDRFDAAVDEAVANPFLVAALAGVRTHLARIRRLTRRDEQRLRAAASEHLLIIDAIIAGDASLAAHATHVHLHQSLRSALRHARAAQQGAEPPEELAASPPEEDAARVA